MSENRDFMVIRVSLTDQFDGPVHANLPARLPSASPLLVRSDRLAATRAPLCSWRLQPAHPRETARGQRPLRSMRPFGREHWWSDGHSQSPDPNAVISALRPAGPYSGPFAAIYPARRLAIAG